jgi:hypothetical protein
MNGVLKATTESLSKATIRRFLISIAVGSAISALAADVLLGHPWIRGWTFLVPLSMAWGLWVIAFVVRLRFVGFLPTDAYRLIPAALQPWIRFWFLMRTGLLGGWALLLLAAVGTALVGGPIHYPLEAFFYLVLAQVLLDGLFGAVFNIGLVKGRQSAA